MQDPNKAHTPLGLLFAGEPSIVVTLKDQGIHSVEQGANFPTARWEAANKLDANLGRELADYQRRCQEYLKKAEEALPYQEMQREIASRGDTVRQLRSLNSKYRTVSALCTPRPSLLISPTRARRIYTIPSSL
jgi:hypothetical protein